MLFQACAMENLVAKFASICRSTHVSIGFDRLRNAIAHLDGDLDCPIFLYTGCRLHPDHKADSEWQVCLGHPLTSKLSAGILRRSRDFSRGKCRSPQDEAPNPIRCKFYSMEASDQEVWSLSCHASQAPRPVPNTL